MPKRKPREVTGFERELVELLDAVAPGGVEVSRTKRIFDEGRAGFCVRFVTRSTICDYLDDDLSEAIAVAAADAESGEEDPPIPMFHRLNRLQREVVRRVLELHAAKHMGRAAKAKLGAGGAANAEYALADAFNAALYALRIADHDDDMSGMPLPGTPKLEDEGPPEPVHVSKPPRRRKAG
jgi:hypothetical protein